MIESYKRFWTNLGNFSGTSDRPDYWWTVLVNFILGVIIAVIIQMATGHPLSEIYSWGNIASISIYQVIVFIIWFATLSLKVRRLHDSNHSGWWILLYLIPLIGAIWFFILMLLPTRPNRWSNNITNE